MSFEVLSFFTISLKAVVKPTLAFSGFVGYGELWLFSPLKADGFLALTIRNLLSTMWSYLSFDIFWSYWMTHYLSKTLDSSQGFFSPKLLKFTV